jgi:hypothetical protein
MDKTISIRISADLAEVIADLAAADRRTVSNWCHHHLDLAARVKVAPASVEHVHTHPVRRRSRGWRLWEI